MSAQRAVRRDDEDYEKKSWWKNFLISKYNNERTNDGGKMKHSANIHDIYTCNLSPLSFPTPRLGMESFNYSSHPFKFFSFSLSSSFVIYHRISSCRRGMMLSHREFLPQQYQQHTNGERWRNMLEFNFLSLIFILSPLQPPNCCCRLRK